MAALSDFHRTKSGSNRHTSHATKEQFGDNKWKNFAIQVCLVMGSGKPKISENPKAQMRSSDEVHYVFSFRFVCNCTYTYRNPFRSPCVRNNLPKKN